MVEADYHVSSVLIAQKLKIAQKIIWRHLNRAGHKTKLDIWCHTRYASKTHDSTQFSTANRKIIATKSISGNWL